MGILSRGLCVAPIEAQTTGYRYGKGIYFADRFSKSLDYCQKYDSGNNGLLLLCEVAMGKMAELNENTCTGTKLQRNNFYKI